MKLCLKNERSEKGKKAEHLAMFSNQSGCKPLKSSENKL